MARSSVTPVSCIRRCARRSACPPASGAVELDLDALIAAGPSSVAARPFSSYPVAKEDVALIVPAEVAAAEVEAALVEGAGELLESIRLFDLYTGEQIGEGKKSLAFALRFRAPDRTLNGERGGGRPPGRGPGRGRALRRSPTGRLVDDGRGAR